jgi:hypothetical protein
VKALLKRARPLALTAAVAVAFGACDEKLAGGIGCPALCPQLPTTIRDTTFFAVELDTAIAGYPALGTEVQFFLASMGDTLQTRVVVRYDSLPNTFRRLNSAEDSLITAVDTGAFVKLRIVTGDTLDAPTTIELYDVDLDGAEESDPTAVAAAFTPDRLLGSRTFAAESLKDTARVPIDPAKLLAKIQVDTPPGRLRLGVRVSSTSERSSMSLIAHNAGGGAQLTFRPSTDSTVPLITVFPLSKTAPEPFLLNDFADYLVIAKPPPDPPPDVFRVGGLPGRRAYLRFNIPTRILDSSNVVRATLQLTQRPNSFSPQATDTIAIQHLKVTAGAAVTDIARALLFLDRIRFRFNDSILVTAADSGVREFEMIHLARDWRGTSPDTTPRAVALRATREGELARQVDFFSLEAAAGQRPRLRITYVPRREEVLP